MTQVDKVKESLKAGKGNLRCKEVAAMLESLGFTVRDGAKGGHRIYVHPGLPKFKSASFNCGHGKNPEIKPAYITNIIRILEDHQDALAEFLKGADHE